MSGGLNIQVDHVTICGSDLGSLEQDFAALGLATDYGGQHASGVTQMALLGFDDGSYIELIAPVHQSEPLPPTAYWSKEIMGNAGPCGWAIRANDVARDVERARAAGIRSSDPLHGSRRRADGTAVEWDMATLGEGMGTRLPFIIKDRTPRSYRVQVSRSVKGSALTGIALVVLGVADLEKAISEFCGLYGWPSPQVADHPDFGATLAYFAGAPVVLASPLTQDSWLAQRLARSGDLPVAYFIRTKDFSTACSQYPIRRYRDWFGWKLGWFDFSARRSKFDLSGERPPVVPRNDWWLGIAGE